MPGVARRKNSDLDAIPDLDSVELGLLLEAIQRSAADAPSRLLNQGLLELLNECGIRELANSPDFGRVDVEILRRVCEKGEQSEPELFRRIEKEVVKFGWAARVALKKRVEVNGGVRLARLWGLDGEETRVLVNSSRAPVPAKDQGLLQSAAQKLDKGHELANKCAEILGDYLGDFIALICGLYDDIATVVLGGGVLRKCTGGIARRRAMERAKKYGIDVRGDPDGNFFTPVKQEDPASTPSPHGGTQSKAGNGPNPDFGTLGAAAFAAGEWLASQKQKGLNGIRAMLMRLHPNESVVISEGRKGLVVSADDQELCLDESALSKQEVVEYLDKEGSSLGFYRSSFADAPDPTFTRWVVEL
jgi:hypothetical protein